MTIKNTIDSYRKRRRKILPLILGIMAAILVVAGIIIVVTSMGKGGLTIFATKTFTPTITSSPTVTPTQTETPTITSTSTITSTPTASAIYPYVVKEGDYLGKIIDDQGLADTADALIIIYMLNPSIDPNTDFITVGQTILLPPPNYPLPTATFIPTGLAPGTRVTYRILPGDTPDGIAAKFNSTVKQIALLNPKIFTEGETSTIYPGQLIIVPINLVTPVPTAKPSSTPTP